MRPRIDRLSFAVAAIVFATLTLLIPSFFDRLDPLTGDEPFYVMTAISIIRDRDLDESNNYAQRDFEEFYPDDPLPEGWRGWPAFPRTLPPHPAVTARDGLYTKHGIGLSLLIAVPYEVLGRLGGVLVVTVAGAVLAANMFLFAVDSGVSRRLAALLAVGLSVSLPIAPYALLLFPEVPAALLLLYGVRRFASPDNSRLQWCVAGLAVGFLPWLHQRFALTAGALTLLAVARAARSHRLREALPALVIIGLGALSIIGYNLWLYGSPLQNRDDHAGFSGAAGTLNGLFGLLLDAQWGLLIVAPIYLLAIVGAPAWLRAHPRIAITVLTGILPYISIIAAYRVWWGEWGPAARYLVPVIPLAIAPIGIVIEQLSIRGKVVAIVFAIPTVVFGLVAVGNPQRMYHHPDGFNNLVGVAGEWLGVGLADKLVVFQPYAVSAVTDRVAVSVIPLAALIIGTALALRSRANA